MLTLIFSGSFHQPSGVKVSSTYSGQTDIKVVAAETPANGKTINIKDPFATTTRVYSNGTGAGQYNILVARPITLVSTTLAMDLNALVDEDGSTKNAARVREFRVVVQETSLDRVLLVYQGASGGWAFLPDQAHALSAMPGGTAAVVLSDPESVGSGVGMVTGGSSHNIVFDSGAHTITFELLIMACTAVT